MNPEEIRQEHEPFLAELEGKAIQALGSKDWSQFYMFIGDFVAQNFPEALLPPPLSEAEVEQEAERSFSDYSPIEISKLVLEE